MSELTKSGVLKWNNNNNGWKSNHIVETQILNYNMVKITFKDQKAADRVYITRPSDQRIAMHIERSTRTEYATKIKSRGLNQFHPGNSSGEQGHRR